MKYFCFSDVHGNYGAMIAALNNAGYEPYNINHTLISCGDNFGRANDYKGSKAIWEYLTDKMHVNKPICIRGNHEGILLNIIRKNFISYSDEKNGEVNTIASFAECSVNEAIFEPEMIQKAAKTGIEEWINELPWYFETKNYIFTHAWVPDNTNFKHLDKELSSAWDGATWSHTMDKFDEFKNMYPNGCGKTLVVGHWHSSDFWKKEKNEIKDEPYYSEQYKIWFIDSCTVLTHKVNIVTIED